MPPNPEFRSRVQRSFERQRVMRLLEAKLTRVEAGEVDIELPFREDLTQQHGYLHAGVVTTIVDSACGYAALTLMPSDAAVLAVEFKANFLSPAVGDRMVARGRVVKSGRTITVCQGDVVARTGHDEKLVATMQATVMSVHNRGIAD